jgi:ribosomal protein L37AE/L43A
MANTMKRTLPVNTKVSKTVNQTKNNRISSRIFSIPQCDSEEESDEELQEESTPEIPKHKEESKAAADEEIQIQPSNIAFEKMMIQAMQEESKNVQFDRQDLAKCPDCKRLFNRDRLEKHMKVCKKVFGTQRKVYNKPRVPEEAINLKLAGSKSKQAKMVFKWRTQRPK